MLEKNKGLEKEQGTKSEATELNLDSLDKVKGGGLGNVVYTKTTEISQDTKDKI